MVEFSDIEAESNSPRHISKPQRIPSNIQKFYENTVIFITGGSGFLGTLLIEKLLRSCPGILKIYILIRPKKGKTSQQRFEEMFNNVVYNKLKQEQPNFHGKVCLVLGDLSVPGLGITEEDRIKLINEVNVVFHVGATVNFEEKIRKAVAINVNGTKQILQISESMKNLKAFSHVSTAYSNCYLSEIDEKFYDIQINPDQLIEVVDALTDEQLDTVEAKLIEPWPNTYAYTKGIAESLVSSYGKKIPTSIIRPSIVIPTAKEPIAGWVNNLYGAVGMFIGAGLGVIRIFHCYPDYLADLIPADYCVNTAIASAWAISKKQSMEKEDGTASNVVFDDLKEDKNTIIYNCVSSPQNPITWRRFMYYCETYGLQYPSPLCIWYYFFFLTSSKYVYIIGKIFLHYIPGIMFDTCLWIIGKKPRLLKTYKKIHKFMEAIRYFSHRQYKFHNHNTQSLWKKLNMTDRQLFDFDISTLSWKEFFYTFVRGSRIFLLKDPLDTLPQAKKRYIKLKIAHYAVLTIVFFGIFRFIWALLMAFIKLFV